VAFGASTLARADDASCFADIDRSGVIDAADLGSLLVAWGPVGPGGSAADLDANGVVSGSDLTALLVAWSAGVPCSVLSWATVLEGLPDPAVVTDEGLRQAILATGFPWRIRDNGTQIEMLLIPPGNFDMGCSASNAFDCATNESPVHAVTLSDAFYIGRYEVTQAEWQARMGSNPSEFQTPSEEVPLEQVPRRAMDQVSWNMISAPGGFLDGTDLRLPTEAEWEYACRAGTTTAFHGFAGFLNGTSDDTLAGSIAWWGSCCGGNSAEQTHPVGMKAGNGFGLHDMAGNVSEWVHDWYSSTFYSTSPTVNPVGPSTGSLRVLRGGSWTGGTEFLRCSQRGREMVSYASGTSGFRVARTATASRAPTIASVVPPVGTSLGGTAITITGMNLTGTTAVKIGASAATSVSVVSPTTVTAVTPPGSIGAATVSLTTPGGTATLANGFTYSGDWYTVLEQLPDPTVVTSPSLRAAITATGHPWRVRDNGTQIEMVLIPAGTFSMGCSASTLSGCFVDESPVHTVSLTTPFYIGRYEVTQAQWQARTGVNPSWFQPPMTATQGLNRPVEQVSWNMVAGLGGFLSGSGLRLPTEAEWEYSCRAGTTTAFHGFAAFPEGTNSDGVVGAIAWYDPNSAFETHPVGSKSANGFGLFDMAGNVWEMVSDWYAVNFYESSPLVNPLGPSAGKLRVMRGGAWMDDSSCLRSSRRASITPGGGDWTLGFRVARSAQ
jgi:formylglycine-generating enzyme required for sulfatase activity